MSVSRRRNTSGPATAGLNLQWEGGNPVNDPYDHLWKTAANWYSGYDVVPTSADNVYLQYRQTWTGTCYIDSGTAAACYDLNLSFNTAGHLVVQTGGSLTVAHGAPMAGTAGFTGTLDVTGGTVTAAAMYVGWKGAGVVNLEAGSLRVTTQNKDFLDRQYIEVLKPDCSGDVDIEAGVLDLYGNWTTGAWWTSYLGKWIDDGHITAYGGTHYVNVEYDGEGFEGYTRITAGAAIPEPGTMLLAGFGVLVLLLSKRKR